MQRIVDRASQIPDCDRICVVTNSRFVPQFREWLDTYRNAGGGRVPIDILDDGTSSNEDRLGAIGDIDFAIRCGGIDEDLLVLAGDNLFLFDLGELCRFARARGIGIALKDLKNRELARLYGVVATDREGRVVRFEEKPAAPLSTLVSIGAYYYPRQSLSLIRTYLTEGNRPDQPGNLVAWLYPRVPVYGFVIPGQWYDIGDLESYREANRMFGTRGLEP